MHASRLSRSIVLRAACLLSIPGAGVAPSAVLAETITIGRTWPIAEPDALAEIEARAGALPDMRRAFGPRTGWSAMKAAALARATRSQVRHVTPSYTLDFDIRMPDGRLLYPKGYRFNPLAYVSLPQRLLVIAPRDLPWALRQAKPRDFILLTAGDAIALSNKAGRPLFILEERVKARLGLVVAPVIVSQVGQQLELREFALSREAQP